MDDVIVFILNSVVQFILSLRQIMIPGFNMSLLAVFIAFSFIGIIYSFIIRFFRIEKNNLNKSITRGYFNRRNQLINSARQSSVNNKRTTKYLQKSYKR